MRSACARRAEALAKLLPLLLLLLTVSCRDPRPAPVSIATTTSVENAGLLDALRSAFEEETGIEIHPFVVGSGRALKMGREGRVDVTITHEPRGEGELLATGRAVEQRPFVENRFLLVGPPENPAGITGQMTVPEAMRRIHEVEARFVSRGDESGTHARELELWRFLGIDPASNPEYRPLGQGMSALLRSANELRACALADEATFARLAPALDLTSLATEGDGLRNVYTVTLLRGRSGEVNRSAARFYAWLDSEAGRGVLAEFAARTGGFTLP